MYVVGVFLLFWLLLLLVVFCKFVVDLCFDFGGDDGWFGVIEEKLDIVFGLLLFGELGMDCVRWLNLFCLLVMCVGVEVLWGSFDFFFLLLCNDCECDCVKLFGF